jgi:DNA polymerase III subunit gamma/tau
MAHQSLYRKYRPQAFSDVVGQDHITRTLRNAISEGAVAHAYLFNGPRGTGKTTTARILAKALDCEQGPTPDPDQTCAACVEIAEGRHPDVYELDAASRTGVDAIRDEVINKVNYAATRGGHKVYIIDEVHMLSTSAFNALLKTLEEPPPKTVFVLCTTHPHKVPETIQSRCQRFDFRRISTDDIAARLAGIALSESITVEEGALELIARHAAGGMRDAIGTLDQLATFSGNNVAVADVEGLLGEVDTVRLAEAVALVAARDVAGLFAFVSRLAEEGTDIREFVRGLTAYVRDLFVTLAAGGTAGLVDATEADQAALREQAALFDLDRLSRLLDELGRLTGELRWSPDARLALEVAFARIARPGSELSLEGLAERVAELEKGAVAGSGRPGGGPAPSSVHGASTGSAGDHAVLDPVAGPVSKPATRATPAAPAAPAVTAAAPVAAPAPAPAPAPAKAMKGPDAFDVAELRRRWKDVIRAVKESKPAVSKVFLETEADVDGDTVVVEFAPNRKVLMRRAQEQDAVALLREAIGSVLGWHVAIRYQLGRGAVRPDEIPAPGRPPLPSGTHVETPTAPQPPAGPDELDRMLVEELGAEVIIEHHGDDKEGNRT